MIIGINLSSIRANIEDGKIAESVTVNSTPKIIDVYKRDVLGMHDVLGIKFTFETTYSPDLGSITIDGELLWRGPDAKRVLKNWEERQELDAKIAVEILNGIFRRCLTKAIELAADLRLPPPIRFPIVSQKK